MKNNFCEYMQQQRSVLEYDNAVANAQMMHYYSNN